MTEDDEERVHIRTVSSHSSKQRYEAERKVIEAAKACVLGWEETMVTTNDVIAVEPFSLYARDKLRREVDDLLVAEGE